MIDIKNNKIERGFSQEWVANVYGTEVGMVMWYDNKPVILSSSFVGKQPTEKLKGIAKKQKSMYKLTVPTLCKSKIITYGGSGFIRLISWKTQNKNEDKKMILAFFYHLLDVVVINSWL